MDASINEYAGKSEKEKKELREYRDSVGISVDYVRPYFQKFTRFYSLFAGNRPAEADTTFSQIMLWQPYSTIEKEIPISLKSFFSSPDWIALEASRFEKEPDAPLATQWLKYQLEKKQQFSTSIVPTIQNTHIFGTGYRYYSPMLKKRKSTKRSMKMGDMGIPEGYETSETEENEWIITGRDVNIFNVLPAPMGGQVNPSSENGEDAVDYVIINTWPTKEQLQGNAEKGLFNKREVGLLLKTITETATDPSSEFKNEILGTTSGWTQFSAPSFLKKMQEQMTGSSRYRVAWYMKRDHWMAVAEDRFILYSGKPLYECIPLAKFTGSYNLNNWYGTGLIEPSEDLIISMILNFNHRMDYLAGIFHPAKWVPQRLADDNGGDMSIFDPEPYKVSTYNHKQFPQGIGAYIHTDRTENINQQAFIEDDKMKGYIEEIIGQYSIQSLSGETASTGMNLISKDIARPMMRAVNIENSGIMDSARLTMKMNRQLMTEPEFIRVSNADGFPWKEIDPEILDDDYGVTLIGSRELELSESNFRRMLSTAQYLLNNPEAKGQKEIIRQLATSGKFRNVDTILNGNPEDEISQAGMQNGMAGSQSQPTTPNQPSVGSPSGSNVQNDMNSMMAATAGGGGVLV